MSFDHFEQRATENYPDPSATTNPYTISGSDRWWTLELRADWQPTEAFRLDAGSTLQLHHAVERTSSQSDPSLQGEMSSSYQRVNSWLLAELHALPTLALNAGLTLSNHSLFPSRLTPKAAAVWQPTGDDTLKAIWSNGFRPPTLLEALFHDNTSFLANRELRPETVSSLELDYEHRFGKKASIGVDLFRNEYHDLIRYETVPAPGLGRAPDPSNPMDFRQLAMNTGGTDLLGGELLTTLRFAEVLQAQGGVSVQRVNGSRANFPELSANLALSSRAVFNPLLLSVIGTTLSSRDKDTSATPGIVSSPARWSS